MPINPDVALAAELGADRIRLEQQRCAALPPGTGRRRRPDGPARAALPGRRHAAGAADVRQRGRHLPRHQAADRAVSRHRHRAEQGSARQRAGDRARAAAAVGLGEGRHPVHRHLGQGQGRGDLVRDQSDRAGRDAAVDAAAVDLRPRRRRVRRRARAVDVGGAHRTGRRISSSTSRCCRSRRCSTGSAAIAIRCTPIPNSPLPQAFRGRSCMACAPTA